MGLFRFDFMGCGWWLWLVYGSFGNGSGSGMVVGDLCV